jgi:hypothetical protein
MLSDATLNGEAATFQNVDMVFIGSETGQLEMTYHPGVSN